MRFTKHRTQRALASFSCMLGGARHSVVPLLSLAPFQLKFSVNLFPLTLRAAALGQNGLFRTVADGWGRCCLVLRRKAAGIWSFNLSFRNLAHICAWLVSLCVLACLLLLFLPLALSTPESLTFTLYSDNAKKMMIPRLRRCLRHRMSSLSRYVCFFPSVSQKYLLSLT